MKPFQIGIFIYLWNLNGLLSFTHKCENLEFDFQESKILKKSFNNLHKEFYWQNLNVYDFAHFQFS